MARVSLRRNVGKGKNMELSPAGQLYATAYAAHYTDHDLRSAFRLYQELRTAYPDEIEADYASMQIQNIIKSVVPEQELLDSQIELVMAHFEVDRQLRVALLDPASNQAELALPEHQVAKE